MSYSCDTCKYSTNVIHSYNKHLQTKKHINAENKKNSTASVETSDKDADNNDIIEICETKKERSLLTIATETIDALITHKADLEEQLAEKDKQIVELTKKVNTTINGNNNTLNDINMHNIILVLNDQSVNLNELVKKIILSELIGILKSHPDEEETQGEDLI